MKNVNVKTCPCGHPGSSGNRLFPVIDPGGSIKVRSGPAFHQHTRRCVPGTGICSRHGICDEPSQKSDGNRNAPCVSGIHVRSFLCGMLYKYGKHLPLAYLGELFGTSVIGGLLSYPIATLIMGSESAVFGFVLPFLYRAAAERSSRLYLLPR